MKKIEIKNEKDVLNTLKSGRIVEGRLALVTTDDGSILIEFAAYNRQNKRSKDKLIAELEHGWLKESPKRYKFFNSVKKTLTIPQVQLAMQSDMNMAMAELDVIGLFKMN
ncbi:MAG: hypothetical protein J5720_08500 [Bacteroidaceae bacterium]|nr:hypothetical protein [Bacteroidaceae bacterium]